MSAQLMSRSRPVLYNLGVELEQRKKEQKQTKHTSRIISLFILFFPLTTWKMKQDPFELFLSFQFLIYFELDEHPKLARPH